MMFTGIQESGTLGNVARPRSPEGKHVAMSARFTDAEAEAIDAVLAGLTRSEWLRRAGLAMMRKGHEAVRAQLAVEPYTPEELQALHDKIAAEDATP